MTGLSSLHMLVIDDNPHMRGIVVAILRGAGFVRVKEANDGAQALEEMRAGIPDIIICDLNMNPIDGLEFTRMLRTASDSPGAYIPVIMMTGHTERSKVTAARDAGINELVAKPISARTLLERIVAVIDRPRPFVKTATYSGPCRRRGTPKDYMGPLRRKGDKPREVAAQLAEAQS
jgi:two-component system, chemotaxis family, chemotaxis protein CheY